MIELPSPDEMAAIIARTEGRISPEFRALMDLSAMDALEGGDGLSPFTEPDTTN